MLERPTIRSTWLPLGLAVVAMAILNLGLYTRLAAQPVTIAYEFPYQENFSELTSVPYDEFGGDWEIRDQMLVQLSTSGYDLTSYVQMELPAEQQYRFEATLRFLGGQMGGGLLFNAQQTSSRQQSHMVRFNVDGGQLWLIYGFFGDDSDFIGQGSVPLEIVPDDPNPRRMRVQVTENAYSIYLDDALLAPDIPLQYQGGSVGFISATSQMGFDDVVVDVPLDDAPQQEVVAGEQPVQEEVAPTEAPVVIPDANQQLFFADSFDPNADGESLWLPISGNWFYENSSLVQGQTDGYDLSNIYQVPVPYPMTLRATFQHRQAAGGGVLFNMPNADNKNGGHMVRYVDAGDVIAWGYFDADGVFNGQGSATVPLPELNEHTLEIIANGSTYAISIDGAEITRDIPLNNPASPSHIGLTASLSAVAFNQVDVFTTGDAESLTETTANIDADAATGTWIVDGGNITQTDVELTDYIAGTGIAGERFVVSADILLPAENPDAGAGITFHMDGRDDPRLGTMVRFGSGGSELFWGRYDAEGNFNGEGGIPLELAARDTHSLQLIVRDETFDIVVDGVSMVEAIPLQSGGGWIGLVSFSGSVTFSNVRLELGE